MRLACFALLSLAAAAAPACSPGTDLAFLSYTHEDITQLTTVNVNASLASASRSDNLVFESWRGTMTPAGIDAFADATHDAEDGWEPSSYGCSQCTTFERLTFESGYQEVTIEFSPAHVPDELQPLVLHSHELVDAFTRCRASELVIQDQATCR